MDADGYANQQPEEKRSHVKIDNFGNTQNLDHYNCEENHSHDFLARDCISFSSYPEKNECNHMNRN